MKKWIQRIIFIILILIVIVMVSVLGYQKLYKDKKQKQEGDVIVKENVKVITSDMDKKKKPINVNDDNLVFESNPKYKEGDVIVAGEISGAENGFIRKVVSVKKATGGYVVETQSALLTDVFEKAYIEKRLKLTKDGVQEVSNNVSKKDTDKAVEIVQMMSAKMEKNYSVIEMADKKKDSSSSDGTETQDDSKSKEDSDKKTQKDSKSKEDDDKETRNDSKLKEGSSEESGVSMLQADITKADDSEFVPSFPDGTNTDFSTLGNFIVAKVHIIGELDMKRDSDFTPVDSGATFYAVVPESYLGIREFVGQAGNVDEFSFDYPTPYAFIAEAPDGTFTAGEERDVVKILKSFKVAE